MSPVNTERLPCGFCSPLLRPAPDIHDSTEKDIVFINASSSECRISHSIFPTWRMISLSIRPVPRPEIVDVQDLPGEAGSVFGEAVVSVFFGEDILRPADLYEPDKKQDEPAHRRDPSKYIGNILRSLKRLHLHLHIHSKLNLPRRAVHVVSREE